VSQDAAERALDATDREILKFFARVYEGEKRAPTVREVATVIGLNLQSTHRRLLILVDGGKLARRQTGGGMGVFTLP
jgi:DNA-binding IclR family transcriptional regulator